MSLLSTAPDSIDDFDDDLDDEEEDDDDDAAFFFVLFVGLLSLILLAGLLALSLSNDPLVLLPELEDFVNADDAPPQTELANELSARGVQ
jgi:hypothetical protein